MTDDRTTKWGRNPDTLMVILTGLLMVIGIVTAWIFYGQFRQMSIQTGILNTQAQQAAADSVEASKKTEAQLAIAQQQVKAAQNSVEAIQHSLEVQQRAWVGLSRPIVPTSFQLIPRISVQVEIPLKNFGHSPAMKVLAVMMPVTHKEIHERAPRACKLILDFVSGTIPKNQLQPGEPQLRRGLMLNPDEEATLRSQLVTTRSTRTRLIHFIFLDALLIAINPGIHAQLAFAWKLRGWPRTLNWGRHSHLAPYITTRTNRIQIRTPPENTPS